MKTKSSRFDRLVAQHYLAVYSFATRLTDDPREAIALTRDAFNSARKQAENAGAAKRATRHCRRLPTVKELIRADSRTALMAQAFLRRFADRCDEILAPGEVLKLVETGNHAQGCIFRDGMRLRTEALERVIDEISQRLPRFFIGRYDIRYENEEDFKQGRNFYIVELNGATSEATSIYDPRNSIFSAYRTLFQPWRLVFAIGAANRANGHAPSSLGVLWRNWRQYSAAALWYPLAD
jgi:hypothetical protein